MREAGARLTVVGEPCSPHRMRPAKLYARRLTLAEVCEFRAHVKACIANFRKPASKPSMATLQLQMWRTD